MNKKYYPEPELEVIRMQAESVIRTSGEIDEAEGEVVWSKRYVFMEN